MNLILAILSILLFLLIEPISFFYVVFIKEKFKWDRASGYWRRLAIAVDSFGNYQYKSLFNSCLIKSSGYQFGIFEETISSVLGKNEYDKTLTKTGKILVKILNWIDKNHCFKSIDTSKGDWKFPEEHINEEYIERDFQVYRKTN